MKTLNDAPNLRLVRWSRLKCCAQASYQLLDMSGDQVFPIIYPNFVRNPTKGLGFTHEHGRANGCRNHKAVWGIITKQHSHHQA